jgi:photosystem II stability/assembly factor-like uncharacterized protein
MTGDEMSTSRIGVAAAVILAVTALPAWSQPAARGPAATSAATGSSLLDPLITALEWRSIGPANMSGRVTDVEGLPSPSKTFYVASAAGGVWKTTNNGTTFRPLFQNERVASLGDLAIAPSDTLQIWVGTGEEDSRNSISPGAGIYKSVDGGLTWTLMGLEKTETIARIVVHPTNPDIVYVAALGAIWRSNPERGLYRTTDGGRTWKLVKFVSDKAGFVDVVMHPRDPNVLFASSYERQRTPYSLQSGGPGSALWKTTDGGETWTEVKGGGFPETMKGRISLDWSRSNPNVLYAMVEAEAPDGATGGCRAAKEGGCGLYRSADGGRTWEWRAPQNVRPFYYSQVRVDPWDEDRVYWSSTPVNFSNDGGRTVGTATVGLHVDHHAMWIDPNDPQRIVVGNDGGVGVSFDRGGSYIFPNTFPLGQFYAVSFDMAMPYNVCGGLQDNGTWCGPSRRARGITNHNWATINGGDGFVTAQDPRDANIIYGESQGGNMMRIDMRNGQVTRLVKPSWRTVHRMWEDSIALLQPDPMVAPDAATQRRIDAFRRNQVRDSADYEMRYNWNTPFLLSPHNPDVFYAGANRVLKSNYRGDDLFPISPDLTTRDTMRIRVSTTVTGGITPDVTGAEMYSTIVSLAESPVRRGMLFAGTDDGNVWLSPDDGGSWTDLTPRFRNLVPAKTYVSRIEPSPHDANRFYVTFDRHRDGDFRPYVFVTRDGGRTFRSIAGGLPSDGIDFVHVIREDPTNPNLLFVGTDTGVYMSLDQGASWQKFMTGLPTTPVHDLKIHPRDRELIAGTHGRSIWIVDIAPLQQMTPQLIAAAEPVLFESAPGLAYGETPIGGESTGHQWFVTPGVQGGANLTWYNPRMTEPLSFVVQNAAGDTVQVLTGSGREGIQRLNWNLRPRQVSTTGPLSPSERRDSLVTMRRVDGVADSLIASGLNDAVVRRAVSVLKGEPQIPQAMMQAMQTAAGGGQQPASVWNDRPGETSPGQAGGGFGGAAGGGGRGGANAELQQALAAFRAAGVPGMPGVQLGGGFGGGGFGGAAAAPVDSGEYTVTVTIDGRTLTQKLRVVHGM